MPERAHALDLLTSLAYADLANPWVLGLDEPCARCRSVAADVALGASLPYVSARHTRILRPALADDRCSAPSRRLRIDRRDRRRGHGSGRIHRRAAAGSARGWPADRDRIPARLGEKLPQGHGPARQQQAVEYGALQKRAGRSSKAKSSHAIASTWSSTGSSDARSVCTTRSFRPEKRT